MKSLLFLFAVLLAASGPPTLFGQNNLVPERRVQILREAKAGYEKTQTYHDRGAVRMVRLKKDDIVGSGTFSGRILEEKNIVFETAYRKAERQKNESRSLRDGNGGDIRLLVATFGQGRSEYRALLRKSGSVSFQSSGVGETFGFGDLTSRIQEAFSFQFVDGNHLPRLLSDPHYHSTIFPLNPSVKEATFIGLLVYEISGSVQSDFVTLWLERNTLLIVGMERIHPTSTELYIARTLYKPKRNLILEDSHFSYISAEDLIYDPSEWQFPALDVPTLTDKISRLPPQETSPPPPVRIAADLPEDRHLPPHMRRQPSPPPASTPPPSAPAESPPAEPTTPEQVLQHLSTEDMASIVLIEGETGQGTGFMCRIKGLSFVVTNLHVLAGTKTLKIRNFRGEVIPVRGIHAARGYDVALIRIDDITTGLKITENAADSLLGDEVVVVGNRLGGGVLTQETGKILGIGPDRLEVDAKFQPGNSGSPILNLRTGEVVGVATYLQKVTMLGDGPATTDDDGKPTRELSTRWFGYRLDSIQEWERVDWVEWQRQGAQVQQFGEKSDAVLGLLQSERSVYMANPIIRGIVERYERTIGLHRLSPTERARANRSLVKDLLNFCRSDMNALDGTFYDYFRSSDYFDTSIPLQQEFRQQLTDHLESRERDFRQIILR